MTCPYLKYRDSDADHDFDHVRPYCGLSDSFVSPMRADICNDRHDFTHEADCEIFQQFGADEVKERLPVEATD